MLVLIVEFNKSLVMIDKNYEPVLESKRVSEHHQNLTI